MSKCSWKPLHTPLKGGGVFCKGSAGVLQGFCRGSAQGIARVLQIISSAGVLQGFCRGSAQGSARVLQIMSSAWRAELIPNFRSDSARVLQILQIN